MKLGRRRFLKFLGGLVAAPAAFVAAPVKLAPAVPAVVAPLKADLPSGIYKNNFLSAKIREHAAAKSVFARFADPEPSYPPGNGRVIPISRMLDL